MAAMKRLMSDWRALEKAPVAYAGARPRDDDLTLWDAAILVDVKDGKGLCPVHFLIDFPHDYPQTAPSVGFSTAFEYHGGASYTKSDGRLNGHFVVCLDLLGNFNFVHTEWADQRGSGWSPAYTVSTLLLQLQMVLSEETSLKNSAVELRRSAEKHKEALDGLTLLTGAELVDWGRAQATCGAHAEAVVAYAKAHQLELTPLLDLIARVKGDAAEAAAPPEGPKVDPNIVCFATGLSYTDAVLGVGVRKAGKNIGTMAELFSLEAFEGGLRQGTDKSSFEWFLPVWVNQAHAADRTSWRNALMQAVESLGKNAFETSSRQEAALAVFPRLINQMVVEMMRPDAEKTEALAYFEALVNFWRTFRYIVEKDTRVRDKVLKTLQGFVRSESERHKDVNPDLGMVLAMFLVAQGLPGCPQRAAFCEAYLDENVVRCVMWWKRDNNSTPDAIFTATKVSREILLFQQMVLKVVVGDDVAATLLLLEETNCRPTSILERLQKEWREQKASVTTWPKFFEAAAAEPRAAAPWLSRAEERAAAKGPKYANGKGKGKGKGRKGKGW